MSNYEGAFQVLREPERTIPWERLLASRPFMTQGCPFVIKKAISLRYGLLTSSERTMINLYIYTVNHFIYTSELSSMSVLFVARITRKKIFRSLRCFRCHDTAY